MTSRLVFRCLVAAMLACCSLLPRTAFADTYQIFSLGSDAARSMYGVDDTGTVVLDTSGYCTNSCYAIYTNGNYAFTTYSTPDFAFNSGSTCDFAAPNGYAVQHAVCNNGRLAWTGFEKDKEHSTKVYMGPDPTTDFLADGGEGSLMMNAYGDVVWDDHFSEEFYEAFMPATTPEPSSVALVLTGALAGMEALRRRRLAV